MIRLAPIFASLALLGIFANPAAIHADPAETPKLAAESMAAMDSCGARNDIVKALSDQFKEAPQAVGVVDKSAVLEVFVSDAGTWTIIATGTDGNSCILSAGEGWQSTAFVAGRDA
jgi:hypothetical protein